MLFFVLSMRLMKRLLANRRNISFPEAETQDKILAILVFLDRFMYSVDLTTYECRFGPAGVMPSLNQ
jgi:hypothetical protein